MSIPPTGPAPAFAEATGAELDALLAGADQALAEGYPGERPGRQPVHTVCVPADGFRPDLAAQWGRAALRTLADCAPGPAEFGAAMDLPAGLAAEVLPLVQAKLAAEPVEDLRLDFEDGYGDRGDAAEDADARAAAGALAAAVAAGAAPPFTGLRCKSLEAATRRRAVETLDVFLGALLSHGPLPDGFGGRLTGLHYGTYDYSAALGIAAGYQSMDHPVADYARAVMQVAAAGTGCGCPTARPTCCRAATATRWSQPGGCTRGWSGGRCGAGSIRAGICIPGTWSAGTPPATRSSARACRPPRPG